MIRNDEKVNNVGARRMQQSALVALHPSSSSQDIYLLLEMKSEMQSDQKMQTSDLNTSKMQRF